ncbi:MAG: ABC transporter ATP-binding protein [Leptospirales bacterium]|nr:ABC transporter ATP-binding protein [Leptospirales bacterium]
MSAQNPILKLENLHRSYGYKPVLKGVDLTLHAGEVVCLMGENGAGKTTLIDTVLSRLRPPVGTIAYNGKTIESAADRAELLSRAGVLGHEAGVFADLSALENLSLFYRAYYGHVDEVGDKRITNLLGMAGLAHRQHDLVRTFSRGMRQKLGICRMMLHSPDMLFLDEPLSALDTMGVAFFFDVVAEFRQGLCALVVTHDAAPFRRVANRFERLENGRIS